MIEYITGFEKAAEVKMIRAAFTKHAVLVVEGDQDSKWLTRFVDSTACYVLSARGRDIVVDCLRRLNAEGFSGVLGIADADFWHIEKDAPHVANLLVSDLHDAEMMIVSSSAFDAVLAEYGSSTKLSEFRRHNNVEDLREWLLAQARPVGSLRLLSHRRGYGLAFEGLKFAKVVDRERMFLDRRECVRRVLSSYSGKLKCEDVERECMEIESEGLDLWQLCCGHDVVALLAEALRRAWGSQQASIASAENIGKVLRLAFSFPDFCKTRLFGEIRSWEEGNAPYRVFAIETAT